MSRVELALNVRNVDAAIKFYSKLLKAEPAKRRSGYANFSINNPPLKLVLIENAEATGTLNHLGVEVETTEEVTLASAHFKYLGIETTPETNVTCCYALQDKVWVDDPDGTSWKIYTVSADSQVRDVKSTEVSARQCACK